MIHFDVTGGISAKAWVGTFSRFNSYNAVSRATR